MESNQLIYQLDFGGHIRKPWYEKEQYLFEELNEVF